MAKTIGVWGIDIGRCALKALRCRLDGDAVVADGFDYIEYPKLLTQPEADPLAADQRGAGTVPLAEQREGRQGCHLASRANRAWHDISSRRRSMSKKIADIVKYEARQQIPFALEDVIWDYQRMAGGQEVDGFALDTEIGLFAMKREAVTKAMAAVRHGRHRGRHHPALRRSRSTTTSPTTVARQLREGEEYSSESPPPSTVVLSIGTDTTDLVMTNGYRVWQRNIPLGGNHFTKQLSKDMKLTFAKAEHLKRNPKQADDPKAIFQAMRPVFADMVTEVQRSVGFFQSLDRKAKIGSVVMLGNTVKLPGLCNISPSTWATTSRRSIPSTSSAGPMSSPRRRFKDNVLAFSTCYGLCLQGAGQGQALHQPAAAGNPHPADDSGQKALGDCGPGGGGSGVRTELRLQLSQSGSGHSRSRG